MDYIKDKVGKLFGKNISININWNSLYHSIELMNSHNTEPDPILAVGGT